MQRRGFLQALVAAAAGLSATKAVVASATPRLAEPVPLAPPQAAVTANTSGFSSSLSAAQATVAEMIKECRVITYSHSVGVHGSPSRLTVFYRHAPRHPREKLDDTVDAMLADRPHAIASVSVSTRVEDEVSVFDAESLMYGYTGFQKTYSEIEVEYIA